MLSSFISGFISATKKSQEFNLVSWHEQEEELYSLCGSSYAISLSKKLTVLASGISQWAPSVSGVTFQLFLIYKAQSKFSSSFWLSKALHLHCMITYTDFWPSHFTKGLLVLIFHSCLFQCTRALLSRGCTCPWAAQFTAAAIPSYHLSNLRHMWTSPCFYQKRWLRYRKLKATD